MTRPAHIARIDDDDDPFEEGAPERYFNRELSWLAFNRRVLEEACNAAHPLLERLRFLSISGSNLDEFFMVRVAGLKGQQLQDVDRRSADGLTAGQQLAAITREADALLASQQEVWRDIRHALRETGITVLGSRAIDGALGSDEIGWLETHFREQVFPVLTPQALDPAHPFPFMPNRGMAVMFDLVRDSDDEPIRELVMLPAAMARFVRLPGENARYVALESLLKRFSGMLFPGYRVEGAAEFRVLRDSDIEIEEEAEDLVRYFANAIKRRRRGRVIRLELETGMPETLAVPALFAALLWLLAATAGRRGNPLEWRPLHRLGEISYATYLGHYLLWTLFKLAVVRVAATYLQLGAYLVVVLVASAALYALVERPAQRWLGDARLPASRRRVPC